MNGVRPLCGEEAGVMSALVSDQIAPPDRAELPHGETIASAIHLEVGASDSAVSTSHCETPCVLHAVPGVCGPACPSN